MADPTQEELKLIENTEESMTRKSPGQRYYEKDSRNQNSTAPKWHELNGSTQSAWENHPDVKRD